MTADVIEFPERPGHAHLTICIAPDGQVTFYPDGNPEQLVHALELLVRAFTEHPQAIRCAAGACQYDDH